MLYTLLVRAQRRLIPLTPRKAWTSNIVTHHAVDPVSLGMAPVSLEMAPVRLEMEPVSLEIIPREFGNHSP